MKTSLLLKTTTVLALLLSCLSCQAPDVETFHRGSSPVQNDDVNPTDNKLGPTVEVPPTVTDPTDTPTETNNALSTPVDILWVVDDGQSMGNMQLQFSNQLSSLVNNFPQGIDFNMAIIATSDNTVTNRVSEDFPLNRQTLQEDKAAFLEELQEKIKVGSSATEEISTSGILRGHRFLDANPDWIRDDAYLLVIYLSNRDDLSYPGRIIPVTQWVDTMQMMHKPDDHQKLKICSIVCQDCPRYTEAATTTGGIALDIGQPLSFALENFLETFLP